jgi:hypothetical protein
MCVGSGFSGFWYHLGYFHHSLDLDDGDSLCTVNHDSDSHICNATSPPTDTVNPRASQYFYCYSSGCLSLVLTSLNYSVDEVYDVCSRLQREWWAGEISQYDIVRGMLHAILEPYRHDGMAVPKTLASLLPRLRVLVTTTHEGVVARTATSIEELIEHLLHTTLIPFGTSATPVRVGATLQPLPVETSLSEQHGGSSSSRDRGAIFESPALALNNYILDGGFSRWWHPVCDRAINVPLTFSMFVHTFNPGLGRAQVHEFYDMGQRDGIKDRQKSSARIDTIL